MFIFKKWGLLSLLFLNSLNLFSFDLKDVYPKILEKLIFFKDDRFKVFYGGPVNRGSTGARWIMPVSFDDELGKTRSVYEIAFINCDIKDAKDAEVLFVKVSDIHIKFKNTMSCDFRVFDELMSGRYAPKKKYIVVRESDVSMIYYPDIFIDSIDGLSKEEDKITIVKFLENKYGTKSSYREFYSGGHARVLDFETEEQLVYKPVEIKMNLPNVIGTFNVIEIIRKNDPWKVYYIISEKALDMRNASQVQLPVLVRFDSGCLSGQVYGDDACDCSEQLFEGFSQILEYRGGILIHIPAHDGRGFGTAPKAETEIYKVGGQGRVHTTSPVDTVTAAKMLYETDNFDLRTFDGAVEILKQFDIDKVILLTDNVLKVQTLKDHGFEVFRKKTETYKESCAEHSEAKKNDQHYFGN